MSKFSVAGVSIHNGKVKVRFCADSVLRIKNLQKQGDTDIDLIELPYPMTKVEACELLLQQDNFKKYASDIQAILVKKQLKVSKNGAIIEAEQEEIRQEVALNKHMVVA